MPINNITQTISTIPPAGARGVDVQTIFVIKQEDFQDHLQGTTVSELNALKTQINTTVSGMNNAVTNVNTKASEADADALSASNSAGVATTKAGEASTSASQASASATKSSQWADNNYNVAVETGKYSAKHWATEASNVVTNKIDKVSSTDNAIVRFDGTTGTVQNSGVVIDDNGNVGIGDNNPTYKLSLASSALSSTAGSKVTSFSKYTIVDTNASFLRFDTVRTSAGSSHHSSEERIQKVIDVTEMGYIGFGADTVKLGNNSGDKVILDVSGNLLLTSGTGALGYGSGAGGTVTQLTNKNYNVTLNKPTGTIITSNSTLVSGQGAWFTFLNSLLSVNDNLKLTPRGSINYDIDIIDIYNGAAAIRIINRDSISRSDAISINFAIIKGATA